MKWDTKYIVGAIIVPLVLAVAGWWISAPASNSITSGPNNTGIVTQGQTGNNLIIPVPVPASIGAVTAPNQSLFIYNGPNSDIEGSTFSGIEIQGSAQILHNEGTFKNNIMKNVRESSDPSFPGHFGARIHLDRADVHQILPSRTKQTGP